MKDLYSKLGIDRGASAKEVQAALEIKPELSDYAMILLDTEKRALYDSTHSTLKMIGELRFRLGLDSGRSWFLEHCPDFAFRKNTAKSSQNPAKDGTTDTSDNANPADQQPKSVAPTPPAQSKWPTKWLIPAALLIIGVIVIALLLW